MMGPTRTEHLLVAVIGNSDVQIVAVPTRAEAGDETGKSDRGARQAGETLLRRPDAGETVAHEIPFLLPIDRVLERQGQRPDRIALLATDQREGERHRVADTLFYAKVVRWHLCAALDCPPEAIAIELG